MTRTLLSAVALAAVVAGAASAQAAEKINYLLNWVPGGDHAPYFFAQEQGWYRDAGLDVTIETGKGSAVSAQRVGLGTTQFALSDMATALVSKGKGADVVAVMVVYANAPYGIYWQKSSGITGPKDFPGKKLGNPPGDAARVLWPAFAKAVGIPVDSVTFVNISPQGKLAALQSGAIDLTTDFYNGHDVKIREMGDNMGYLLWRDAGVNTYGNSILVNGEYLRKNRESVGKFVAVTQRAFAACTKAEGACIDALLKNASGLKREEHLDQWKRVKELMTDATTTTVALGAFDPARVQADYRLVETYFGIEKPFPAETAFTNDFLDKAVKMPKPQ